MRVAVTALDSVRTGVGGAGGGAATSVVGPPLASGSARRKAARSAASSPARSTASTTVPVVDGLSGLARATGSVGALEPLREVATAMKAACRSEGRLRIDRIMDTGESSILMMRVSRDRSE